MEAAGAAACVRGGSLVRARTRAAYGGARGPRRVVGAGLAAPGRRRVPVAVAALPEPLEPLPSLAQDGGAIAHSPQTDEEVHGHATAAVAETSSPGGASGKTVRVRFVLKKQCPFGQSFHLVGDDPALGLWDPSDAVALQWAEGHEWIVEKDLPANKLIEFKFLLQDTSGKLHWQIGPNRSFQTGETVNMLVVYEDWSDVKNQIIAEEGEASWIGTEEAVVSDDSKSRKDNVIEDELQMDDKKDVKQDESFVAEDENSVIAINVSDQGESMKVNIADPTEPLLHEELKMLDQLYEKADKENYNSLFSDKSRAEKTEEDNILSEDGVPVENGLTNAYEHDLLWGWKAMQKLLMSLGFKMDTS